MAVYINKLTHVLVDVDEITAETLGDDWSAVPQHVSDEPPGVEQVRTRRGRPPRD